MTYAAAGLALAVASLAACNGSDPAPAQTSAQVPSTTTSASTSTTPAPSASTSAGPAFPAGLPDAAKTKDKAGAEAFAKYYMSTWSRAWTTPNPELLRPLCDVNTAKACASAIADAQMYKTKGWRYDGAATKFTSARALAPENGAQRVLYQGVQLKRDVVDASGKVHESYQQEPLQFMFFLEWRSAGWLLTDLRLVS